MAGIKGSILPILLIIIRCWLASADTGLSVLSSQDFMQEVGECDIFIVTWDQSESSDLDALNSIRQFGVKATILTDLEQGLSLKYPNSSLIIHLGRDASIERMRQLCAHCKLLVRSGIEIPKHLLAFNSQIYQLDEEGSTVRVAEIYLANDHVVSNLILAFNHQTREVTKGLEYIWDRRKNLYNTHLKIIGSLIGSNIAYDNETETYYGPFADMLEYLKSELNFSYTIVLHPESLYGSKDANGTWTGRIGMILNNEGDMIMAAMSINEERAQVVDYGPVIKKGFVTFAMIDPYKNNLLDAKAYVNIFVLESWLTYTLVGSLLVLSLGFLWSFQGNRLLSACSTSFGSIAPACLLLSSDVTASNSSRMSSRILLFTMWITLYLVFQMYASGLTSLMTAKNQVNNLRSFRDLYEQGYELNCAKGTSYESLLQRARPGTAYYDFYYKRMQAHNILPLHGDVVEHTRLNPGAAYITTDFSTTDSDFVNMGKLDDSVVDLIAPVFPKGSQYKELLSYHLYKMVQSGLIDRLYKKWKLKKAFPSLKPSPFQCFSLEVGHVTFLIVVLLGGIGIGLILCLAEKAYNILVK